MRRAFFIAAAIALAGELLFALAWPPGLWSLAVVGPLLALGLYDAFQTEHTLLRTFPLLGRGRFLFEMVRPEIQQYFIESNIDAHPIEREFRALVYQRSKRELETKPFGTERDTYRIGYEWAAHSMRPLDPPAEAARLRVGGERCSAPYEASLLNISAMSFGALSSHAIRALSEGAALGGFALNTGEGGISRHHLEGGAELIWQIGTGYFGCRTPDGRFDPEAFARAASDPRVRMIELKLSQGAKPGHGGVLPGVKVTREIAAARGVEPGKTVVSPPAHSAFDSPLGLVRFLDRLRELSGGKPVGFKLCVGREVEFLAICKAILETGLAPDFVTVDGGEGGTGAAPLEFSNSLGMPGRDAWVFVRNALVGTGLRPAVRIFASGRILTGFHMIRALALGADACYSARGFMFALGCIQALRCNTNRCPTGVATQRPDLVAGLVVARKRERVANFHRATLASFCDLLRAMGIQDPSELGPSHIYRRVADMRVRTFAELYEFLQPGELLAGSPPPAWKRDWEAARADRFA